MKKILLSSLLLASGVTWAADPFVVKDIRVDGMQPDSQGALLSSLPIKVGQNTTDADIAKMVAQLQSINRYKEVSGSRDGDTIVLKIVEQPILNNVKIQGNSAIPLDALEQNLKANYISRGEIYDEARVDSFREALIDHYRAIGRMNVKIDKEITKEPDDRLNLTLTITEGEVSYVKSINFEGNKDVPSDELLKRLDIQPDVSWWNIFESSRYDQQGLTTDTNTLRDYYMSRGYAKFEMQEPEAVFSNDNKDVALTYRLKEGDKYTVTAVRILGDTANMQDELNRSLENYHLNELFNGKELGNIQEDIRAKLAAQGFANAKVDLYPKFNEADKTMVVNFVVEAGKRYYVRQIHFEGNVVTADSTLRREMRQQEGAWMSSDALNLGKIRLERTGFYESVELSTPNVPNTTDQVDAVYKVRERNTGSVNFGISYGSESGFGYQAGIKQDNFLGLGTTLSLSGSRNDYGTGIDLGYTEPYFTKDGVSLGGNIYYSDYDNSKSTTAAVYKRQTYGISGTLGFPVDENNSYYISAGFENDKLNNVQREFSRQIYVNSLGKSVDQDDNYYKKIHTRDFWTSFGWNYNSLNRGYFPTSGLKANIGGKITVPGSDNKYYRLSADFSHYLPLNREHKWVLNTRASVGYANGFGGRQLPFFQTYTAGGIGSLRGFDYGAIGPRAFYLEGNSVTPSSDVIGGNAMATASVELIMPTPFVSEKYQNNVRTSLFVDAATVWDTKWKEKIKNTGLANYSIDYGDYKRYRASTGVALQWNSPIGPLVFSYATPLRKQEGDSEERFQFSIGGSF